jgi:hypothetical protein
MAGNSRLRHFRSAVLSISLIAVSAPCAGVSAADAPVPLLQAGKPVDWWFAFKFNTASFPLCPGTETRACTFGGTVQTYPENFSQQFIYASRDHPSLQDGTTCIGDTANDPVGATFAQAYDGPYYYVVWNDQFYNDPDLRACNHHTDCEAPWGHSKGIVAWNDDGNGFVMQVSTPNWPGAGNRNSPRARNGNTLGCITRDGTKPQDDILLSQHFFSVKLNREDVVKVLKAMQHASIVTAPNNRQIVNSGGPEEIRQQVQKLGVVSPDTGYTNDTLSTGVQLIAKSSNLQVPPWQMVSAVLGRAPLKVATFWETSKIPDTDKNTTIGCWDPALGEPKGVAVANATTGRWAGKQFGLTGGSGPKDNHAKIGVSVSGNLAIFGDMNQEGALSGPHCDVHQNGRGGLFFVVEDQVLSAGLRDLLGGTGN